MSPLPDPAWTHVGSSSNAEFYVLADDILGVLPHPQCTDDEKTARESLAFQRKHWESVGHRGAAVIFMDRVLVQDNGARAVYERESVGIPTTCFALVGETFFGQVTSAIYTGLQKPAIPTVAFPSLADAMPWIAEQNRVRGGRL